MSSGSRQHVLITGGAGFIGSHLADELLHAGHRVRILDHPGRESKRTARLRSDIELFAGDIRDSATVRKSLDGVDAVFHLAAVAGDGSEIRRCTETNVVGTAVLMEALIENPVEKLIVASSMSIYGEGLYAGPNGRIQTVRGRHLTQLEEGIWEVYDDEGHVLRPVPTPELKRPALKSVYALSKHDQERMCLILGRAHAIPTVALRFFNVYGPRLSASNPYTGFLADFAARYLNGLPPLVPEDGGQMRDLVYVSDAARACRLALESPRAVSEVFNIGSGNAYPLWEVAEMMGRALGNSHIEPEITGIHRQGDIRHCFADISKARERLGYEPTVPLEQGLERLGGWIAEQVEEELSVLNPPARRGIALPSSGSRSNTTPIS